MKRARLACLWAIAATLTVAACVENVTAPGKCPDFCPSGSIQILDTLLATNISRDSAFRGYVFAHQATAMAVVNAPGEMDSRAIMASGAQADRVTFPGDTTTHPIVASDSLKLSMIISRRDSVTLSFYRLPLNIDSTTTFPDLAGAFTASPIRTVNLDSLAAGDAITVDSVTQRLTLTVKFDSLQVPYVGADSGRLGIGIRVSGAGPVSLAVASRESDVGSALLTWYVKVDSIQGTNTTRIARSYTVGIRFDSFVFDPPTAALDSTLAVGGVPSARSILRVSLPRAIRDSSQVIRATLILVPAVPARGAPADSFVVEAHTVLADFGAKSPIFFDPTGTDTATIRIGATDTVRIEVTNLVQFWAADSLAAAALMLRSQTEGANPAEIRFCPSAAPACRPSLRLTYARRFPFGVQ